MKAGENPAVAGAEPGLPLDKAAGETCGPTVAQCAEKPPLPENPYHRIYTKNRSFEELARRKRQEKK